MHSIAALLFTFLGISSATAQQSDTVTTETPWQTYGYIALGVIVLIVVVLVLIRKQYRKFNE